VPRELVCGELLRQLEDVVVELGRLIRVPRPLGQLLDAEPLMEQEPQVAPGQERRGGGGTESHD
jgi:hypothetical protein